ncbi:MAG TPA: hypothetical protein VGQ16_07420 [Vicinamibacterales bacterium]|jgi:hypothetical protein|nr:hypothetical protein [Vicinamibacterales bacterium]
MPSSDCPVQRLWSAGGTECVLIEREYAPRYEICVRRGDDVIRQDRLYALASAQMLAETWRTTTVANTRRDQAGRLS